MRIGPNCCGRMPETRRERLVKTTRIFRDAVAHRSVAVQRTRRRMVRRSAARSVKCSGFGPLVALGQLGAIVLGWIAALKGAETITLLPIGTSSFANPGKKTISLHRRSAQAASSAISICGTLTWETVRDALASRRVPSGRTIVTVSDRTFHPSGTEKSGTTRRPRLPSRKWSATVRSSTKSSICLPSAHWHQVRGYSKAERIGWAELPEIDPEISYAACRFIGSTHASQRRTAAKPSVAWDPVEVRRRYGTHPLVT